MVVSERILLVIALLLGSCSGALTLAAESVSAEVIDAFQTHCLDCHSSDAAEGNLILPESISEWSKPEPWDSSQLELWQNVHTMITKKIMPPPDASSPGERKRQVMADWVSDQLMHRSPVGGTALRRLSRREYRNTVESLFGLQGFELPASFPSDNFKHGFDNQAESLVVAASHLEAFAETAIMVADEFFPPRRATVNSRVHLCEGKDLTISYSSAMLVDGAMRLASSGDNLARHATWPSRFEASAHGKYRVELTARWFPGGEAKALPIAEIELRNKSTDKLIIQAAGEVSERFRIEAGQWQTIQTEFILDRGETVALRYANGPFDYDDKAEFGVYLERLFEAEPELAAAWDAVGNPARGGSGWDRVKEQLGRDDLPVDQYGPGSDKPGRAQHE